jgi:periplasmic protein TonB
MSLFLNTNSQDSFKEKSADTSKRDNNFLFKEGTSDMVSKTSESEFVEGEENATFRGGDINKFKIWVEQNIVYPVEAVKTKKQGKIIVQFAVDSKGFVVDAKILRGNSSALEKEALRCINTSPQWVPGKKDGKPVKQQFIIPIIYQLK